MADTSLPSAYGDAFADVYDAWYSDLADDDFVTALAAKLPNKPARILELGVGTGRLLRKLVDIRAPHCDALVGVDASEKMLDLARVAGVDSFAQLECQDFSQELPSGPFDAIFVGYNTLFNLPSKEAIQSCLSLVANRLATTGFFLCDLVIPRGDDYEEFSEERRAPNGDRVTSSSRHDPRAQHIAGEFVHTTLNGQVITRPWSVHYVTPPQLDELAVIAGLALHQRTADGNGTPFTDDSSRHISTYILG